MKTNNLNLTHLLLVALIVLLMMADWKPAPVLPATAQSTMEDPCKTGRTVQVSGAAVINVTPDRALIQLGVQSNGATPNGVQEDNFVQIQRVINAVKELGVEAKDIATDYYIVYPIYSDYSDLVIKGYRIDNTVSITLRDISLVDDVIVTALRVGANEVQDVQFYTSELRRYRDQARELAMTAAREKAEALGEAAGANLGCVVSISENTWSTYSGSWGGGREAAIWAQNVFQNAPASGLGAVDSESPLSLGQIAVRAEVSASFSLRSP